MKKEFRNATKTAATITDDVRSDELIYDLINHFDPGVDLRANQNQISALFVFKQISIAGENVSTDDSG